MNRWFPVLRMGRGVARMAARMAALIVLAPAIMAGAQTTSGTLTASPEAVQYDAGFTLTAVLTGASGGVVPTGTVTFSVGSTQVAAGVAIVGGTAVYSPSSAQLLALDAGVYTLTALYSGDGNYGAATLTGSLTVTQVTTATTLVDVVSPIFYGETIADLATEEVSPQPDGGTLDFLINGAVACTLPADTDGSCASQNTGEGYSVGTYMVQSVYSGDTNYTGSSSPVYQVLIQPDPTSVTLTSSLSPSTLGQAVTFAAAIVDIYTVGQGTVNFFDGGAMIGSGVANGQGVATFTTSSLAVGSHAITACLVASENYLASSPCGAVTQVVNPVMVPPPPPMGSFTLTLTPAAISVGVGNTVTVQVAVTALNGFSQPVQLSCSGLPNETTCTFVQTVIASGGGTTGMLVSPAAPHSCGSSTPDFIAPNAKAATAGLMLSMLAMFRLRRRRMWIKGLALLLALSVLPWLGGCGSECKDFGTEPTSYTFTVTGTSMGSPTMTQSVTVPMNVHL